jgi:uncharacterized protein (UPF0147 family)
MKKEKSNLDEVFMALDELNDDTTVPRNVRQKLGEVRIILEADDHSLGVSKALNELEFISGDTNMEAYTRTQVLRVISLLENV